MQLIEGQMCGGFIFFIKKDRLGQINLEKRELELEGQIKMEEMCF